MREINELKNEAITKRKYKHVLVLDDDRNMRQTLADHLGSSFEVSVAADGKTAMRLVSSHNIDLAVVDLNLGSEDGLRVMRDMTARGIPVIIITGNRTDEADKVLGLELGAIDYLTKPFGMREFVARVRSRLRSRSRSRRSNRAVSYRFENFEFSQASRSLRRDDGIEIRLSAGEFNLLSVFVRSPKKVLSRETILNESRVRSEGIFDRSIDVLILRLRRKLEADATQPSLIMTIRNKGYVFQTNVAEVADSA